MPEQQGSCITSVTPTICRLMAISPPGICTAEALDPVIRNMEGQGIARIEKAIIYAPDAVGIHLYRRYESSFTTVLQHAPIRVPLRAVVPPKTPICFASMFTGAMPEGHGIRKPERPVLKCDTLFDALLRAGKRVAIVAVKGSSIDLIFRERPLDYFSEKYDPEVTERVLALLEADRHDVIVAYHQEYDDCLHRTEPYSELSIRGMENYFAAFARIAAAFNRHWRNSNRLLAFTPDHGAHLNETNGRGTHGEDIPDDMDVHHFFAVRRREA